MNGSNGAGPERIEGFDGFVECDAGSVIEWLNSMVPGLSLPLDASEEELRAALIDGTALCSLLERLCPGLIEMRGNSESGLVNVKRFLVAMDELGLPRFILEDLQQGYMKPILQCLGTLKAHFDDNLVEDGIHNYLRRRWNVPDVGFSEVDFSPMDAPIVGEISGAHGEGKQGICHNYKSQHGDDSVISDASSLELTRSSSLDKTSTRTLFIVLNKILDEVTGRKNGHAYHMSCVMKKIVQIIEQRVSTQAENLKDQNVLYKLQADKYQARMRVFATLASGSAEEIEVLQSQLQQIKIEKTKIEEKEKLEEQDLFRLKEERRRRDHENSTLRHELEEAKKIHEKHCIQLKAEAEETKAELEKKLKELESFLIESRKKVKELESFSESKSRRWKKKEWAYRRFIDYQSRALRELRSASESVKHIVLKTQRDYSEEFRCLGVKLKGLADAAESYHSVLAENRRLYNEVQDLKGNIRVYCRIRPFLPGQSKKYTTIEYIGENGELVVSNPLKQGKDGHRLFKFNKVFAPEATQEEVFLDTRPLIRSVLDGYNVCIFAYGQTGSGKTYTMSGPNVSSKEDWGVNYRALHDLFEISQSRRSSISYEVGVQMVEIYNEQVRDLLVSDGSQKRLGIWSTAQPNGLAVPDASMHPVTSTADVLELMDIGLLNRAVGATALNERSSRSHSVLTVHVRGTELKTGAVLRGSLHLVDLAGSERVDRSEVTGDRLREAQHINKSLSALGDVIFALAQKSQHVPYRNSKLTQVLQSSLGGQAKTLMFVQLNPDVDSFLETISTLKFAERVSGVELGAARSNKEGRDIKEIMEQVASLRDAIAKKDEEIERLQHLRTTVNGEKSSMSLLRGASTSPRRHSMGTPQSSPRLPRGKGSGSFQKASSDVDNSSEYSERHSDTGSLQSMDDFGHPKKFLLQSKSMFDGRRQKEFLCRPNLPGSDVGQNSKDDIDLLGFGDADSDERLSDISDGGLSMGTDEGSMGSAVEFTLFPESAKPIEVAKTTVLANSIGAVQQNSAAESTEKPNFVSKLPKPPQKVVVASARLSRLSLTRSSTSKVSAGKSISAPRKTTASSSSASKTSKRWQ